MNAITSTVRALIGLFFDDGELALQILALLAATALMAKAEVSASWTSIALLVAGTLIILLLNVTRAARNR